MSDTPSKHKRNIAVPAVTAALLAAFGTGAYVVAGGGGAFNPQGLIGSYESGDADANSGYRINTTDAGGDTNRHDGQDKDQEDSVEQVQESRPQAVESAQDAFTDASSASTSQTAYNVTGADDGTGVTVNNGGGASSENSGTGDSGGGGTIVIPDSGGNGGGNGSSDGGASDKKDDSGSKGDSGDKDDPSPTPQPKPSPTDNSYSILPNDPTPKKDTSTDTTLFPSKAGADADEIEQAGEDEVSVSIAPSTNQQLYCGQKLDAWTIFCSLSTTYTYKAAGDSTAQGYRWSCTQEEFDSYPYFQIVSWTDAEGTENPAICPNSELTVTVRYRFSTSGAWHEQTVTCEPQESRVYVLGQTRADGTATILGWCDGGTLNLLTLGGSQLTIDTGTEDLGTSITGRALRDLGYVRDDGTITHLLMGWEEAGEELGYTYDVAPGRHVIQPSGFTELAEGYSVRLQNYSVRLGEDGTSYDSTLQTLVDVDESALADDGESELTLAIPAGIQAVDDARDDKTRTANWSLSSVKLPASALYYNADGPFIVQQTYTVDDANPVYAATKDGLLTSKDGASVMAVPSALAELDVPTGVTSVQIQQVNELDRIYVHAADGSAPALQTDNLRDCEIVIDDGAFDAFVEKNYDALAAADDEGVSICRASDPETHYACSGGMVYSEDALVRVHDNGSDTVFVQIPTTIKAGAFDGATGVTCVVLFNDEDCVLEPGSLAGGNVQTVVCFTEEQAAGVTEQLADAGAPDARVILAQASADDMLYYVDGADGGKVTLLSDQGFASSFDGTVTTEDGEKLQVSAIAPYAFAGDTDLAWVTLDPSVTSIGAYAFQGCNALQGLFIGATDAVTVGTGALEGCESLGFVASLSRDAEFATAEVPNDECAWYCLDSHTGGYDSRFSYVSGVETMSVAPQEDGSLMLYGSFDEGGEAQIVLGSGTSFAGTLVLPSTVTEIFTGAFAGLHGSWTVDWESASGLCWIDARAFADSGITGDLVIGNTAAGDRDYLDIGKYAFQGCSGLTSVTLEADEVELGSYAFAQCDELASATIQSTSGCTLGTGAFVACTALSNLQLTGTAPARLLLESPGLAFSLTGSAEVDKGVALSVPAGCEKSYLASWIYSLAGYATYDEYYAEIQLTLTLEQGFRPTEAQVRERMAQELLAPENRLRRMLGMPEVEASTIIVDSTQEEDGYTFTQGEDGAYTLVSAPADAVDVDLDAAAPEGCTSLTIAAGAFEGCSSLARVELGELVSTIESGAFSGCDGVTVTVPAGRAESITLTGGSADAPFSFGASIVLEVSESEQTALLAAWPMRCLGYASADDLGIWAFDLIMEYLDADDPSAEAVAHINGALLEQENYLRGLMGLDTISTTDELAYQYEFSW